MSGPKNGALVPSPPRSPAFDPSRENPFDFEEGEAEQAVAFANAHVGQVGSPNEYREERAARRRAARQAARETKQKTALAAPGRSVLDVRSASDWMAAAATQATPLRLWGPLWYEGETTILFSTTNAGKSVAAVQVAEAIASGTGAMGFETEAEPQRVLYLDFEMSAKQFERRYSRDFRDHHAFHPNFLRAEINPDVLADEDNFDVAVRAAIEEQVVATGARVVIVDNLTFISRQSQEAKDALPLMRALYKMKREHGLSMLILGHTPKRDPSRPLSINDVAGSAHLANLVDAIVGLGRSAKDPSYRYLKQLKQRSSEEEYGADAVAVLSIEKAHNFLGFTRIGTAPEADHLAETSVSEKAHRDASILALHEQGHSYREVAAKLSCSKNTVGRVVKEAERKAQLDSLALPDDTGTAKSSDSRNVPVPVPERGQGGTPLGQGHGDLPPHAGDGATGAAPDPDRIPF
jgi:hypothetical protein